MGFCCHVTTLKSNTQLSESMPDKFSAFLSLTNRWLIASVDLLSGFQLSTNLELKLEARLVPNYRLSKKPVLISFSSRDQKCCPLQIFSFSSLSLWETEPVWVSSFSSEVRLIQLVEQKWWDPTKKTAKYIKWSNQKTKQKKVKTLSDFQNQDSTTISNPKCYALSIFMPWFHYRILKC